VRRPIEALDFISLEGRLKDHCCKECTGLEIQITRGYLKVFHKECEQEPFGRLEFASEISGGITPLNTSKEDIYRTTSKGNRGRNHLIEVNFRSEDAKSLDRSH
jgi:hypothetical protein